MAQGLEDGLFLVRGSKTKAGEHMLLVCHDNTIHNYRVRLLQSENGPVYSLQEDLAFDTLASLVDFYVADETGERLATRLTTPCPPLMSSGAKPVRRPKYVASALGMSGDGYVLPRVGKPTL